MRSHMIQKSIFSSNFCQNDSWHKSSFKTSDIIFLLECKKSWKNVSNWCQSFQRILKFQDLSVHWFIFTKKFWWTWKLKFDETYVLIFGRKSGNFIDFDLEKQFCKSYLALSNLLAKTCKICKISVSRKFTDSVALYQLSKCCESPIFICLNLEFSRKFPKLRISKQMSCTWLNLSQSCT